MEAKGFLDAGLIKSSSSKIQEIFQTAAKACLNPTNKKSGGDKRKKKKWFDKDCMTMKSKILIYQEKSVAN